MASKRSDMAAVGRRGFLKGAALSGAAAITAGEAKAVPVEAPKKAGAAYPGPLQLAADTERPNADPATQTSSGGDFMTDVLQSAGIDYLFMMCASSFRGLHEAVLNHGGNKPEIIVCVHEEIAAAMAHGYYKIDGKPQAMICHATVGLQHAAMAIYNAWCDRVPMLAMVGNILEEDKRLPGAEWNHSAVDPGALIRDFTKWDDQPANLQHFAESTVRAVRIAQTPPMAPVFISVDAELQENPIEDREKLKIPKLSLPLPAMGEMGALREVAKMLTNAENPVVVVDRLARTPAAVPLLVELAEALQCAIIDVGGRMNFPSQHPLNHSGRARAAIAQADVIVGIEATDLWGLINAHSDRIVRSNRPIYKPTAKLATIGNREMLIKANDQDFGRYQPVDLAISGDGEASLPYLTEQVKKLIDDGRKSALAERGKKLAAAHASMIDAALSNATIGWDASPITSARMCAEVYAQIKDDDWSLVGTSVGLAWPRLLWDMKKPHNWNGGSGGGGVGYNAPASLGAALANKKHGRLTVSFQGDGDFMMCPGTLWTAAHHKIPLLYVMNNNRAWHQEFMYLQAMAGRHQRGARNTRIGTTITDPNIDYANLARSFGVYGEGPISDPKELGPALKRALAVVRNGEPALIDVVTDPR